MSVVNIENIADAITKELTQYGELVTEGVKKGVDKVAKECNEEIKKHITFKQVTGRYVKAFRIKTSFEDKYNKRNTWYVSGSQYRLTHLLENGHANKDGGRTKAYPHIKYGEELAKKRMEELVKEEVEKAGY